MTVPAEYQQKNIITHNEKYLLNLLVRLQEGSPMAEHEAAQLAHMVRDVKFKRYPLEFTTPYYWGRAFIDYKDKHGIDEVIFCGDLGRVYHASWDRKAEYADLQITSQIHYEWTVYVAMYQDVKGVSGLTEVNHPTGDNLCFNIDKAIQSEFGIAFADILCRYDEVIV